MAKASLNVLDVEMRLKIVLEIEPAKIPSWPLFYSLKMNDAKNGFEETMKHSESYLSELEMH